MRFRSKAVEVEAEQYTEQHTPSGVHHHLGHVPYVVTIHGDQAPVIHGDWIITEPDGTHYYPCKPDIFERRYEPLPTVDAASS